MQLTNDTSLIDPYSMEFGREWAHCSENTGKESFISFRTSNAKAGHNDGDMGKKGFAKRVFEIDGTPVIV